MGVLWVVKMVDRGPYQVILSKQTKLQLKILQTWPWFEICKKQIENPGKIIKIKQMIFVLEKFEKAKIWAVTALSPLTGISSRDSG